jgi:hypothetical protein
VVFLTSWRAAALATGIAFTIGAVLLLPWAAGDGGGPAPVGDAARFADVGAEEPPEVDPEVADPSACPNGGNALRLVDRSESETQGFVYAGQAFSQHGCMILVANRPGMSFVRLPLESMITLGEHAASPLPARLYSEHRDIDLDGRSLTVNFSAATRYNDRSPVARHPGLELAISAEDQDGRAYATALDSEGGLWIQSEPIDGATVLNHWSGEALPVSDAREVGKLVPEGQFRWTSCYQPASGEPCNVNYRPLEAGLHAAASGTVRCFPREKQPNSVVDDEIGGIELDTGDVILRFERSHTGIPWLTRAENCEVREVGAGELIGNHYHYQIYAFDEEERRLSVGVTLDGTLVVGDFLPASDCPCTQGN